MLSDDGCEVFFKLINWIIEKEFQSDLISDCLINSKNVGCCALVMFGCGIGGFYLFSWMDTRLVDI